MVDKIGAAVVDVSPQGSAGASAGGCRLSKNFQRCWFIERRENKVGDEFDNMTDEQVEAWLDERAEARVKMRQRDAARSGQHGRSRRASARSASPTTPSAMAELLE
jgi:hypothetical protein